MWVYQRMTYVVAKSMETKPNAACAKFGVTKRRIGPPLTLFKIHEKTLGSLKIIYIQPRTES